MQPKNECVYRYFKGTAASLVAKIAKLGLACTVPGSEFQRRIVRGEVRITVVLSIRVGN